MKTASIIKTATLSTLITLGGCRGPIHKVNEASKFTQYADSLVKETSKALKDSALKCFYRDTVELSSEDLLNSKKYVNELQNRVKSKIPQVIVGKRTTITPSTTIIDPNENITTIPGTIINENVNGDKFKTIKTVVEKGVYTDKKEKLYIPIAGYGK